MEGIEVLGVLRVGQTQVLDQNPEGRIFEDLTRGPFDAGLDVFEERHQWHGLRHWRERGEMQPRGRQKGSRIRDRDGHGPAPEIVLVLFARGTSLPSIAVVVLGFRFLRGDEAGVELGRRL